MSFHVTVACPFATDTEHANTGSVDAANEATGAITAAATASPIPAGTTARFRFKPPEGSFRPLKAEPNLENNPA